MVKFKIFNVLFVVSAILHSCGSTDEAQKRADSFFECMIKKDFDCVQNNSDATLINDKNYNQVIHAFAENENEGKLLSVKKAFGFNTSIENGIAKVKLPYTLKYENNEYKRQVILVDRGKGFRVISIEK